MSKQVDLIKSLIKNTVRGKANWKGTVDPHIFLLSFPKYSVTFSEESSTMPEAGSEPDYVIRIVNLEGNIVEEVRDWDSSLKNAFTPGTESAFSTMQDFYKDVKRQALGFNEAYDYLLKELDRD
jgi:hypothetical protein